VKTKPSSGVAKHTIPEFFSSDVAGARRFYLDLNPPKNLPLVVVWGGREHHMPNYSIRAKPFRFTQLSNVARGRGEVRLNPPCDCN